VRATGIRSCRNAEATPPSTAALRHGQVVDDKGKGWGVRLTRWLAVRGCCTGETRAESVSGEVRTLRPEIDDDAGPGWPAELRFLLERYPREVWQGHANLGAVGRFWLQRHAMFRELGGMLENAMAAFREGQVPARELGGWLAPRLRFFLGQLHEHHLVEDRHYFPVFRAAEPRLVRGFAVLEAEHEAIHHAVAAVAGTGEALLLSLAGPTDGQRQAADRHAATGGALLRQLRRHLADEEDLIVPLILDRGEDRLGIAG
jgi:hypothetical protein